jgi:hypothetical protein
MSAGPLNLPEDARKEVPLYTGVIAYFPAALAYVAKVSQSGQKHHPGQPLHWERAKSRDHADCIARHLAEHTTKDGNGIWHAGMLAWRALALLQELLEREEGAPKPPNAVDPSPDYRNLVQTAQGCVGPKGDPYDQPEPRDVNGPAGPIEGGQGRLLPQREPVHGQVRIVNRSRLGLTNTLETYNANTRTWE